MPCLPTSGKAVVLERKRQKMKLGKRAAGKLKETGNRELTRMGNGGGRNRGSLTIRRGSELPSSLFRKAMPDMMPGKKSASAFAEASAVATLWRDETARQEGREGGGKPPNMNYEL